VQYGSNHNDTKSTKNTKEFPVSTFVLIVYFVVNLFSRSSGFRLQGTTDQPKRKSGAKHVTPQTIYVDDDHAPGNLDLDAHVTSNVQQDQNHKEQRSMNRNSWIPLCSLW